MAENEKIQRPPKVETPKTDRSSITETSLPVTPQDHITPRSPKPPKQDKSNK